MTMAAFDIGISALLASQPIPRGNRVAVLTNAGGLGILCADACEIAGLELPPLSEDTRARLAAVLPSEASSTNPVDMLGSATDAQYADVLPIVLADPSIDAVISLFVPPVAVDTVAVGRARERVTSELKRRGTRSRVRLGPHSTLPVSKWRLRRSRFGSASGLNSFTTSLDWIAVGM